jgi:hypothetical protein
MRPAILIAYIGVANALVLDALVAAESPVQGDCGQNCTDRFW